MEKNKNKLIWIIEDDPGCQFVYEEILDHRFRIRFFDSVQAFKEAISPSTSIPDLIIADLRLPDENFVSYLSTGMDSLLKDIPFMVVSSVDEIDSLRLCYKKGAIDFITKPFGKNELIVKIERILESDTAAASQWSQLQVDPSSMRVMHRNSYSSPLTSREFQIVHMLFQSPNGLQAREQILSQVWGEVKVTPKTLDVHLVNLRKKLERVGIHIRHVPPDRYQLWTQETNEGQPASECSES